MVSDKVGRVILWLIVRPVRSRSLSFHHILTYVAVLATRVCASILKLWGDAVAPMRQFWLCGPPQYG